MGSREDFWDNFWWFIVVYAFFAFLWALFVVFEDLFRDEKLNGWWNAVWVLFLAFVPLLSLLVSLIARGKGTTERSMERARADQKASNEYIRRVATPSPSEEIAQARSVLNSGTISADGYDRVKAKVLA